MTITPKAPDTERLIGTEEAIAKLIVELLRTGSEDAIGKVKVLSDLDDEEIGTLSLLESMGDMLNLKSISKFVQNFCQFRVSRFRMGRREMVNIANFSSIGYEEKRGAKSIRQLFSGFR